MIGIDGRKAGRANSRESAGMREQTGLRVHGGCGWFPGERGCTSREQVDGCNEWKGSGHPRHYAEVYSVPKD